MAEITQNKQKTSRESNQKYLIPLMTGSCRQKDSDNSDNSKKNKIK